MTMIRSRLSVPALLFSGAFLLLASPGLQAGSATWNLNPTSGNWNSATNWTPSTIPNGPADVATFATSSNTLVSLSADVEVSGITFSPGANSFVVSSDPTNVLSITGGGVTNNSGATQQIVVSEDESGDCDGLRFKNNATAGSGVTYTAMPGTLYLYGTGGAIFFEGNSSAGNAVFDIFGVKTNAFRKGALSFSGTSTAANAVISTRGDTGVIPGALTFTQESTAANAIISNGKAAGLGGFLYFWNTASAAQSQISNDGYMVFRDSASAGEAAITNNANSSAGFYSGSINFWNSATAANATIDNAGGDGSGGVGTGLHFISSTTAGAATLIARGGTNGGGGATITFDDTSTGGTARLELFGNGSLDISARDLPGITIGLLEEEGLVFLGANNLTIGSSNLDMLFSGVIQDGGAAGGVGGSLTKIGSGTLTLAGANTYTGATTVGAGVLLAANQTGSATGSGLVSVNASTLGGGGIISGGVEIGSGATLAPAVGSRNQVTLTLQQSLNLTTGAKYVYGFKARASQARTDLVVANGVTISNATIALKGKTQGTLTPGTVLTVISNTSANPIGGTFSNLPEGAIVTVNGNNLQASYTGGDGNDLTLTVIP